MSNLRVRLATVALALVLMTSFLMALVMVSDTVSAYTGHDPIYIDGDEDFIEDNGVIGGSGTPADPFVIEGWEIAPGSEDGIAILNTAAHFIIRDVYVHDTTGLLNASVFIWNAGNGSIENCVFSVSRQTALAISESERVSVTNCSISHSGTGLWIYYSSNISIDRSNVSENTFGIYSYYSTAVDITGNEVGESLENGIISHQSSSVNISRNEVWGSSEVSVYVNSSDSVSVSNNTLSVESAGSEGVHVYSGHHVVVVDNIVNGTSAYDGSSGIKVAYSLGHYVLRNRVTNVSSGIYLYESDSIEVSGCDLSDTQTGIQLHGSSECLVRENNVTSNWVGIRIGSTRSNISDNEISHNYYGVLISGTRNELLNNTVSWNDDRGITLDTWANDCVIMSNDVEHNGADGILVSSAQRAVVAGNTISFNDGHGIQLHGIDCLLFENELLSDGIVLSGWMHREYYNSHTIPSNNTVNGRPVLYVRDATSGTVDGSTAGQVILANCSDVSLTDVDVDDTDIGVQVYYASYCSIDNVVASRCDHAVLIYSSESCQLTHHVLSGNEWGVSIMNSDDIQVSLSNISDNSQWALTTMDSCHISVTNCSIVENEEGISLCYTDNGTVSGNRIIGNVANGVLLYFSENTTVYGNSFILNGIQASEEGGHDNRWNAAYPTGGNYWSDYDEDDLNGGPGQDIPGADGIGDTPYVITGSICDYYPLMALDINEPPLAAIEVSPSMGDVTMLFSFDASDSWDAEDDSSSLEVRWDFDGDGEWDTDWSTEKAATHQYTAPGTYTVKVEVRDTDGLTDNATVTVEVVEVIPEFGSVLMPVLSLLLIAAFVAWRRRVREN